MVIEQNYPAFFEWFPAALGTWLIGLGILCAVIYLVGFLFSGLRLGPKRAFQLMNHAMGRSFIDSVCVSARRIGALARLTFKEAIRRKIVIGFIVFVFIVLFAGMFLDPTSPHPVQLYIHFIFSATGFLTIMLILLLTAFSLPSDLQRKTIHTIVTKPVKISEIVLGRILGFVLLGTVLLVPMGIVSYVFVVRSQVHTHELVVDNLETVASSATSEVSEARRGRTESARQHRHDVYIAPGGDAVEVSPKNDHTHEVTIRTDENGVKHYTLGKPVEMYTSRVVQYADLTYLDQRGMQTNKGVNVGDEWEYRSFIAGGTQAAFIWQFDNVTESRYPDGLPVELTLEVFRTHKGKIDRRVMGNIFIRNPETGLMLEMAYTESQENETAKFLIPRNIDMSQTRNQRRTTTTAKVVPVFLPSREADKAAQSYPPEAARDYSGEAKNQFDLFRDFVASESKRFDENGREVVRKNTIEVWVRCYERGQYFGAAQADMYLRSRDSSFAWNFFKGYFGIWLQMVLVAVYGVMFSTFLSTPVTVLATLFIILGGLFHPFLNSMGLGTLEGGGPFEAAIRVFTQENLTIELDMNSAEIYISKMIDSVFQGFVWLLMHLIPSFDKFDCSNFVAKGFNIPFSVVLMNFTTVLGFSFPLYILGTAFLKNREIER